MMAEHASGRSLGRDAWLRALERTAQISRDEIIFPLLLDRLAEKFKGAPALLSEGQTLSYGDLARRASGFAQWAHQLGIGRGDVVGLMLPNCPDYLAIWLGITRLGGIVALLNTNLLGASLAHSIVSVAPKHLIIHADFADRLTAIRQSLGGPIQFWCCGRDHESIPRLEKRLDHGLSPHQAIRASVPSLDDPALYIYTSGTTGLPKATRITHRRILQWALWMAGLMDTRSEDRIYNCLPMYHSVGGVAAIGALLCSGGSVVLRPGFSARAFWDDLVKEQCTLLQYVGELCRYLTNAPPNVQERQHRLRLCCGNGLRPDVWQAFADRFRIPHILEFYAATEGAVSLYNCEERPGAIGRVPPFLRHRFQVELIKIDVETGQPLRGPDGHCLRCATDEIGEAIGKIGGPASARFDGYTDPAATEKKILRNAFAPGDAWFRTGDLMRRDSDAFYFFVDRIGDTYRWKGENVSTAEVEKVLTACPGVVDAVAYGVAIPGTDGRVGIAALTTEDGFDLVILRRHMREHLPRYACPVFIRLESVLQVTSTFKPVRTTFAADGYNPETIAAPLFFDDPVSCEFVAIDLPLYRRIQSGECQI